MSTIHSPYQVGQPVVGRIEKLLSYGAFVRLEDGTQAYIRRRELTWSGNIDPRGLYQEGQPITAKVLKLAEPDQCLELSHRSTLPDPWDTFTAKTQPGDVVEGTVKSLLSYGVYVEILPGVDGLIPLQELGLEAGQQPEEVVWVGDNVEVVVLSIDRHTRKVRLSLRARLRQLEAGSRIMEYITEIAASAPHELKPEEVKKPLSELEVTPPTFHQIGRILVVDDHREVRLPLTTWLKHRGCTVDSARSAERAHQTIKRRGYNLLFVDLNLPGMDGLAFLRQLKRRGMTCHVAMMSTSEWLAERSREIEEMGVIEVFVKPLELDEIEQFLFRLERGELLPPWRMSARQSRAPESFYQVAAAARVGSSSTEQLASGLQKLVNTTPAEVGLIFSLDPISQTISITAQAGKTHLLNLEAVPTLNASPVRDVIEEGEQILEGQIAGKVQERFRKLLELLPFESCIGVPLEAGPANQRAIFLLHRDSHVFSRYHVRDALAASTLFAAILEREAMEQKSRALNKLLLSGQLAGGFSHEVSNKMSGLEIQLRNLHTECRLAENPAHILGEVRQATEKLLETVNDLKSTVDLFQQLMRTEEGHGVCLNDVIQRVIALLKPVLHKEKIKLDLDLAPNLPHLAGDMVRLEQALLNIVLNGVQQMALKPGARKTLGIATYQTHGKAYPVELHISDTGPGIHRRLWDKIFELGFTTRLGGTGQGLYIARSLIEAAGGKIEVSQSVISIGTTFLVALPLDLSLRRSSD